MQKEHEKMRISAEKHHLQKMLFTRKSSMNMLNWAEKRIEVLEKREQLSETSKKVIQKAVGNNNQSSYINYHVHNNNHESSLFPHHKSRLTHSKDLSKYHLSKYPTNNLPPKESTSKLKKMLFVSPLDE